MIKNIVDEYMKINNIFKRLDWWDIVILIVMFIFTPILGGLLSVYLGSLSQIIAQLIVGVVLLKYLVVRISHILERDEGIEKSKWYSLMWNKSDFRDKVRRDIIKYIEENYSICTNETRNDLVKLFDRYSEDLKFPHILNRAIYAGAILPLYLANVDAWVSYFSSSMQLLFVFDVLMIIFLLMCAYMITMILELTLSRYTAARMISIVIGESNLQDVLIDKSIIIGDFRN